MKDGEYLQIVQDALEKTLNRKVEVTPETNLIDDDVIDSLDGIKFLFEVENMAGVKLPDNEVAQSSLFHVAHLIEQISALKNPENQDKA